MTPEEIRIRRMANQHLLEPSDKLTVVRDLCGVQAQFMSNALHSLKIRCADYDEATVSQGLVKNWTVRGTVHVFAEEDLPLFIHCGADYRRNAWSGHTFWNQRDQWALSPERQKYFTEIILDALAGGPRTREELKDICRIHGMTEPEELSMFDQWGGGIREMCERGFMNYVVQEKKAFCLSPEFTPMPEEEAQLEMARRYFTYMGPATVHDAMYYFHATASQVKKWLSQLPVASAECEGRTYFHIGSGRDVGCGLPPCVFLAGFDQLMLAYEKKESLYLRTEHLRSVFNLAGIVMPTVLLNGSVAGRWKKKSGKLTVELFTPVSSGEKRLIRTCADALWEDLRTLDIA